MFKNKRSSQFDAVLLLTAFANVPFTSAEIKTFYGTNVKKAIKLNF